MSAVQNTATPDGGENLSRLVVGAGVVDRDDDEPDTAVVVNTPGVPAEEWVAYTDDGDDVTVADDNPEHDPEAEVVVVAFLDDLERAHPEYDGDGPLPLAETDCNTYAFPAARLERVEAADLDGADTPDPADHLGEGMRDLLEYLEDAGADVEAVYRGGEPELVVEKLGREHRITTDGEVSDGPLADRLEDLVAEHLGGETA